MKKSVTIPALAAAPQMAFRAPVKTTEEGSLHRKSTSKKRHAHHHPYAKRIIIGASLTVALIGGYLGAKALISHHHLSISSNGIGVPESSDIEPDFQAVLPSNSSIDKLGGWQRISPPGNEPVYAFADKIDGVSVSVSEQPLPASFKGNVDDQIAELAKKFNATTKIDNEGAALYIGTSAKGPQSAILAKNNLLILIKSQTKLSNESWAAYAKSLR